MKQLIEKLQRYVINPVDTEELENEILKDIEDNDEGKFDNSELKDKNELEESFKKLNRKLEEEMSSSTSTGAAPTPPLAQVTVNNIPWSVGRVYKAKRRNKKNADKFINKTPKTEDSGDHELMIYKYTTPDGEEFMDSVHFFDDAFGWDFTTEDDDFKHPMCTTIDSKQGIINWFRNELYAKGADWIQIGDQTWDVPNPIAQSTASSALQTVGEDYKAKREKKIKEALDDDLRRAYFKWKNAPNYSLNYTPDSMDFNTRNAGIKTFDTYWLQDNETGEPVVQGKREDILKFIASN